MGRLLRDLGQCKSHLSSAFLVEKISKPLMAQQLYLSSYQTRTGAEDEGWECYQAGVTELRVIFAPYDQYHLNMALADKKNSQ